jgi:hypothetical protein
MLRSLLALNLLVFLLFCSGTVRGQVRNAVAQSNPEVTVQSLAGKWTGGGSARQTITMTINEDGTYRSIVWIMSGQESANTGRIFVLDGRLRFRNQLGTSGTLTVGVENGERVIRGTFDGRSDTYLLRQVRKDESGAADTVGVSWRISESRWGWGGKDVCSASGAKRESNWDLSITLVGQVEPSIDPTQDDLVRKVLVAGREWAIRNCPPAQKPGARYFNISLYSSRYRKGQEPFVFSVGGDPAAANFRFNNRAPAEAIAQGEGKAKVAISRAVEGFSLQMAQNEATDRLKQAWGREYVPFNYEQKEALTVPSWFNKTRSGQLGQTRTDSGTVLEGLYFKTSTTRFVSLYFYRGRLSNITISLLGPRMLPKWGGGLEEDEVYGKLVEKYGLPKRGAGPFDPAMWEDPATRLAFSNVIGYRTLTYTDRLTETEIQREEQQAGQETTEKAKQERRTAPRGY